MKVSDMLDLKAGQVVLVTSHAHGEFVRERGTVTEVEALGSQYSGVRVVLDHAPRVGRWFFYEEAANFTIEPEHRSTYLNGHSDLGQQGTYLIAWKDGDSYTLSGESFNTQSEADTFANGLAEDNAGNTVVVLRAVSQHTSSVKVETKAL